MTVLSVWRRVKDALSRTRYTDVPAATWLVIGLGNPTDAYAATRHNVGYHAVDVLLSRHAAHFAPVRGIPALVTGITIAGEPVLVVRSTTFMNNSGEAVAPLCAELGIAADHVIVLHDELDLPHGVIRLKKGGNENGHNGLKSVTYQLNTRDYLRVRLGISRPPRTMPVPEYVLSPIEMDDTYHTMLDRAATAVELIVEHGLSIAQNRVHSLS